MYLISDRLKSCYFYRYRYSLALCFVFKIPLDYFGKTLDCATHSMLSRFSNNLAVGMHLCISAFEKKIWKIVTTYRCSSCFYLIVAINSVISNRCNRWFHCIVTNWLTNKYPVLSRREIKGSRASNTLVLSVFFGKLSMISI